MGRWAKIKAKLIQIRLDKWRMQNVYLTTILYSNVRVHVRVHEIQQASK